jgi:hypothetical protein
MVTSSDGGAQFIALHLTNIGGEVTEFVTYFNRTQRFLSQHFRKIRNKQGFIFLAHGLRLSQCTPSSVGAKTSNQGDSS